MKKALIIIGIMAVAGLIIFLAIRGKTKPNDIQKSDLKKKILAAPGNDVKTMAPILDRMSLQELKDTYELVSMTLQKRKPSDQAFIARIEAISKKYNIFT